MVDQTRASEAYRSRKGKSSRVSVYRGKSACEGNPAYEGEPRNHHGESRSTRAKAGFIVALSVLFIAVLSACQGGENESDIVIGEEPIVVSFFTQPETVTAGEAVELVVEVTQDGEPVDDAEEVEFEIWHEDDEQSEEENERGSVSNPSDHSEHHDHDNTSDHNDHAGHSDMADYNTDHELFPAQYAGDGQYSLEHTFEEDGIYYVRYHVTARGFHAMTANEVHVE